MPSGGSRPRCARVFADAGLGTADVDGEEIRRLVANAPKAGRAIVDLYRAWRAAREDAQALQLDLPGGRTRRIVLPTEEARDFFETHANHFAAIEAAAEAAGLARETQADARPASDRPAGAARTTFRRRDRPGGAHGRRAAAL